jgi:hypothetical protein
MKDTARLYNCSRCLSLEFICRSCDRGNVYCLECAPVAQKEARARAAKRYQESHQGRLKHAERQRRYREKLKQKVTHKGSFAVLVRALIRDKQKHAQLRIKAVPTNKQNRIVCCSCNQLCSPFLRNDFLRNTS